jgi:site-specific DNA-methyltransferase (adenine-specific)
VSETLTLNKIYNVDFFDGISQIKDKSVDLIIIDPPYNIGKDEWDKIDNYEEWMFKVFKECERIMKPTGSFYWFHNDFEVISEFQHYLKHNTSFIFRNLIVWNKNLKDNLYIFRYCDSHDKNRTYRKFAEYCLFYTFDDVTDLNYSHIQLMFINQLEHFQEF